MVQLDFSGLDEISNRSADVTYPPVNSKPEDVHDTLEESTDDAKMWASLEREQQIYNKVLASYKSQQNDINSSEHLRSDLLHDAECGASIPDLFLKACRIIALVTGDEAFLSTIEEDLENIYSCGLSDPLVLEQELANVRARRMRLQESLKASSMTQDCRKRIETAIEAHSKKEAEILDKFYHSKDSH